MLVVGRGAVLLLVRWVEREAVHTGPVPQRTEGVPGRALTARGRRSPHTGALQHTCPAHGSTKRLQAWSSAAPAQVWQVAPPEAPSGVELEDRARSEIISRLTPAAQVMRVLRVMRGVECLSQEQSTNRPKAVGQATASPLRLREGAACAPRKLFVGKNMGESDINRYLFMPPAHARGATPTTKSTALQL